LIRDFLESLLGLFDQLENSRLDVFGTNFVKGEGTGGVKERIGHDLVAKAHALAA
jgi:hypothetical protein